MTFPTADHIAAAQTAADRLWASTGFYCWPSASLAQTMIESANGTKVSGKNNYHGIKANPAQIAAGDYTICPTREIENGVSVKTTAKFANFKSLADSYEQHARLFLRVKDANGVWLYADGIRATNSVDFVRGIAYHYASAEKDPDPSKRYSTIVIKIMTERHLYQYDKPVAERGKATGSQVSPPDIPAPVPSAPPQSPLGRLWSWLTGKTA